MADINIEIQHQLSQDQAILKLEQLLAQKDKNDALFKGLDVTRRNDTFSFSGKIKNFNVSGKMTVFDKGLRVIVIMPWTARPFHKPASKYIREYLETNLAGC